MNPMIEQKAVSRLECKFDSVDNEDGKMTFTGYGAVFNNVDGGGDLIVPGAFAKSLAKHAAEGSAPMMFLNHDAHGSLPIGKWIEMSEDGHGLKVKGELLETTAGRDTYIALKAGALTGLSIGYRAIKFDTRSKASDPRRTLKELEVMEVSVVGLPMNGRARIQAVKSLSEDMTIADLEALLQDCGMSKSESIGIANKFESKSELAEQKAINDAVDKLAARFRAH